MTIVLKCLQRIFKFIRKVKKIMFFNVILDFINCQKQTLQFEIVLIDLYIIDYLIMLFYRNRNKFNK